MKTANRSTGDRNESEWKDLAGKNRTRAIHKSGECRHVQGWMESDDTDGQQRDGPQLDERAQIVAWCEEQPNRQSRCRKSVDDDEDCQGWRGQSKNARHFRILRRPLSAPNRQ